MENILRSSNLLAAALSQKLAPTASTHVKRGALSLLSNS